ncbi:MAG: FecR domain-containing protein [Lacunisphaera sp.]|nr:FecR domain-containing protein [Lacunisphaera sp.]
MKNSSEFGSTIEAGGDAERGVLDWPRHAGMVDQLLPVIAQRVRRRRQRRLGAVAASLAILLGCGLVWSGRQVQSLEKAPVQLASVLVLPTTQVLADGSVVQLRDGAEISVAFEEGFRRVILKRGEAHFQVTKNARRPFIVVAAGMEVRAVGTAFGVQLGDKAIEVLVTEGRVAVEQAASSAQSETTPAPATLAMLDAGHRVMIGTETAGQTPPEVIAVSPTEIDEKMSWRAPRLDLSGTSLDEVIRLFNQHGRTRFVLTDPALGKLQISGLLRVDHPELLVRILERDLGIRAERHDGDEILLFKAR